MGAHHYSKEEPYFQKKTLYETIMGSLVKERGNRGGDKMRGFEILLSDVLDPKKKKD